MLFNTCWLKKKSGRHRPHAGAREAKYGKLTTQKSFIAPFLYLQLDDILPEFEIDTNLV